MLNFSFLAPRFRRFRHASGAHCTRSVQCMERLGTTEAWLPSHAQHTNIWEIMASTNSRFDRDVNTSDVIDAEEAFVRIEPFSSDNLVSMRSSKPQENRATISLHPPCSSPTFDQHTRLPVRNRSRKKRLVSKNGSLKVSAKNVPRKTKLYFADLFTTMIDLHWPWVILIFCGSYVLSWILFGLMWWLLVALRGPSVCVTEVNKDKISFWFF